MVKKYKFSTGDPGILGTHETKDGLNFAVRIPDDLPASLVLLREDGCGILQEIELPADARCGEVAAVVLSGRRMAPIAYYYVVDGKRTIDPYARRIIGDVCYTDPERFNWDGDVPPAIPLSDMIIYKLHVRGFTKDPESGVRAKGTFRGLVQKIPYLVSLGINAVELMPAYEWSDELKRTDPGMKDADGLPARNYWGYAEKNCYYAPKQLFSSRPDSVTEFKMMVKAFHRAGIEVILEMCFPKDSDQYEAVSALHFWKTVYHVDGFHVIGSGVPKEALAADPLLARTKLFFEWIDAGRIYAEKPPRVRHIATYNGYYQSEARRFLKGDGGVARSFRWTQRTNPATHATVNYAANVNGFTLADAVTFNARHNEANGEGGADGPSDNNSWNCGVEGFTRRKPVLQLRRKQIRNALTYVFLSQGIPLLYAGDEFCNSQGGNNNAYASDDPSGWVSWGRAGRNKDITDYVRQLIAFRKEHPILHRERELRTSDYLGLGAPEISFHDTKAWYTDENSQCHTFAIMYNGAYARKKDGTADEAIYVCFNAHWESHAFALPRLPRGRVWEIEFSTDEDGFEKAGEEFVRWAKEDALDDLHTRLDRLLAGLESHRELVRMEEERQKAEELAAAAKEAEEGTGPADVEDPAGDAADGTEAADIPAGTDEVKAPVPQIKRVPDFDALRAEYIRDAEAAAARIEESFETAEFPKNQKYIALPPRSVAVLVGRTDTSGES